MSIVSVQCLASVLRCLLRELAVQLVTGFLAVNQNLYYELLGHLSMIKTL